MKVLIRLWFIFYFSAGTSMPCFARRSYTEVRDLLCPIDMSFSLSLKTKLGLSLFIA
jgi:hypothetical protein